MIAILVFAIIVWISEAMDYTASAIVISALIIFMVGFAPDMNHPDTILGTAKALKMTLSGFLILLWRWWQQQCLSRRQ